MCQLAHSEAGKQQEGQGLANQKQHARTQWVDRIAVSSSTGVLSFVWSLPVCCAICRKAPIRQFQIFTGDEAAAI